MADKTTTVRTSSIVQYSVLAVPLAFAGMPLYVHAPDFYATEHNVSLASLGLVLLGLRAFDAVQDPLIGRVSDHLNATQRLGMMLSALVMLVIAFFAIFQPFSEGYVLVWFAVAMLFATTAFSILGINMNMLGGMWSRDPHTKTRIAAHRESLGLVGLLLAVSLPSVFMTYTPKPEAFFWLSVVLAVFAAVAGCLFLRWYRLKAIKFSHRAQQQESYSTCLKKLPKTTRVFFGIYGISMLASSIPAVLVLFFIRDRLAIPENEAGIYLVLYFLAGVLGMPLWQRMSRLFGKYKAWIFSMLLAVVSFIWAFSLEAGDALQYGIICVMSGIAFGADLALPPSILADKIHQHKQESFASTQFGIFSFLSKLALALASAMVLPVLESYGFRAGQANSEDALWVLGLFYAAIPCAIKTLAMILLIVQQKKIHNEGDGDDQNTYNNLHDGGITHAK